MAENNAAVLKFDNTEELLKIMAACYKLREEEQIGLLIGQMKEMEKNFASVQKELSAVKKQMETLTQGMTPETKEDLIQTAEDVASKAAQQHQNLHSIDRHLESRSKQAVQKFKEAGISALDKVTQFLGIKEKLTVLRDNARSTETAMKNSIEKLEKIERELAATKFHAKNVIRSIAGKETPSAPPEQKSKLFEMLKAPYVKRLKKYSKRVSRLNKSIAKYDSLERKAQEIRTGRQTEAEKPRFKAVYLDANMQRREISADTKEQAIWAVREAGADLKKTAKCSILEYDARTGEYQTEGIYLAASGKDVTPVRFNIPQTIGKEAFKLVRQEMKDDGIQLKLSPDRKTCYVERFVGDEAVNKVRQCLERHSKAPVQDRVGQTGQEQNKKEQNKEAGQEQSRQKQARKEQAVPARGSEEKTAKSRPRYRSVYYEGGDRRELYANTKEAALTKTKEAKTELKETDRCYINEYDSKSGTYKKEGIYLIDSGNTVEPVKPQTHTRQKPSVRDKLAQNKESAAKNDQRSPMRQKEHADRQRECAAR